MPHFLIVEDDVNELYRIADELSQTYLGAHVILFDCEGAFHQNFARIVQCPPDVFIVDMMIQWSDLPPGSPLGKTPTDYSVYRAGCRIVARIRESQALSCLPILINSTLDPGDYANEFVPKPANLFFIKKGISLKSLLDSLLPNAPKREDNSWFKRFLESTSASIKFAGLSIDLKNLLAKHISRSR